MARRKNDEAPENPWQGRPMALPIKYHPMAIMPAQIVAGNVGDWRYVTSDGYVVSLECRGASDASHQESRNLLEYDSQRLYGMSFASIEAVWARRLGRLDVWWQIVKMNKIDA